jgi:hypothetical protein
MPWYSVLFCVLLWWFCGLDSWIGGLAFFALICWLWETVVPLLFDALANRLADKVAARVADRLANPKGTA